jgi:hypothetical protein
MALPLNSWDSDSTGTPPNVVGIVDPDHNYGGPTQSGGPTIGWVSDYDGGNRDGFCHEYGNLLWTHPCPSYAYVQLGGDPNHYDNGDITPYLNIAQTYGFANYMFATHEGPSNEGHQFPFTGTSAPVAPGNNYGWDFDFVAEYSTLGCPDSGTGPKWAYADGTEHADQLGVQCYAHDTLVTDASDCGKPPNGPKYCDRLLGSTPLSWGYYEPRKYPQWDAPRDIPQTCYGQRSRPNQPPYSCGSGLGTEYGDHVHSPGDPIPWNPGQTYSYAPIFDDLTNCHLPQISWVIPDGRWSDHPNAVNPSTWALGPFWVGDIIDAVGTACQGRYWSGSEPTAVIVTWDDWGGWYDHIPPWAFYGYGSGEGGYNGGTPYCNAPNNWGCGYVSGFRVPLLVASAWTGNPQQSGAPWVSGACGQPPLHSCPNPGQYNVYVHDFGSVLAFTEWNFGYPQTIAPPYYADYNAPDWGGLPPPNSPTVPLSDFFQLTTPRQFVPVSIKNNPWPYTCFQEWGTCNNTEPYVPEDPDAY